MREYWHTAATSPCEHVTLRTDDEGACGDWEPQACERLAPGQSLNPFDRSPASSPTHRQPRSSLHQRAIEALEHSGGMRPRQGMSTVRRRKAEKSWRDPALMSSSASEIHWRRSSWRPERLARHADRLHDAATDRTAVISPTSQRTLRPNARSVDVSMLRALQNVPGS